LFAGVSALVAGGGTGGRNCRPNALTPGDGPTQNRAIVALNERKTPMKDEAKLVVNLCTEALRSVRGADNRSAVLQPLETRLNDIGRYSTLPPEEKARLADLKNSAAGYLNSLERHGYTSAGQGCLDTLSRMAERV